MASKRLSLALTQLVLMTSFLTDVRGAWEDEVLARLETLELASNSLIRQTILQQFSQEEARRSDGDSGLKQVRNSIDGTRAYYSATHASHAAAAIHDHTDNIRTCGMGEFEAVLNGVHFRTRHNDYGLYMPSETSGDYHRTDPIALPDVPPAVLNAGDVVAQIREMRAWFRAWQEQDFSVRDYRDYFKPLMCYLEGAWTNNENLDEPFESTRHHLDAASWFDLQEKVRFTAYTGDKDQAENFAYLPTAIFNITDGVPVLGQWNYRILCHPIQDRLLELQHLKPVDDLSSRLRLHRNLDEFIQTRAARFQISRHSMDRATYSGDTLLDRIMAQIPGKDNYVGNIEDSALGRTKYEVGDGSQVLNTAFYHRWYKIGENDAMGVSVNHRGFADRNLFVAQSTQDRVVPMEVEVCDRETDVCNTYRKRVSYAVPLEVVWLTPLNSWNPYDIEYKGWRGSELGQTVTADGRNGGFTESTALNGTNEINYMLTPVEFFNGGEVNPNPADTVRGAVGVLDRNGVVRTVSESGVRIFLPEIVDVPGGNIRTRYPVFPTFSEGGTTFKEVEALEKIVMDLEANARYLHAQPNFGSATPPPSTDSPWYTLVTSSSDASAGVHVHHVELQTEQALEAINDGEFIVIRTTLANAHSHLLNITFNANTQQFSYVHCDGGPENQLCWDGHPQPLFRED